MQRDRPAKAAVREIWVNRIAAGASRHEQGERPLYLTLSGAHGRDIELLIQRGILSLTDVGSIAESDADLVVAVENSPDAELALKTKFPGLKVVRQAVQDLIKSGNLLRGPTGVHEHYCRASFVNLDLDEPLGGKFETDQLSFPVLQWIAKFAELHAKRPVIHWVLFLTLQAQIPWEPLVCTRVQQNLAENFGRVPRFAESARALLGDDLYEALSERDPIDWRSRPPQDSQHLLMALVPKRLAQMLHDRGWFVRTVTNYRYGGEPPHASPMVTWVIEFHWDPRSSVTPDVVYSEGLQTALASVGSIE